ncbi:MAG: L-serine ammonia-lyase, iron-sulfur-dependent, subunit alpha [Deltaproteobacteria bacterium]|nr:L-serine ammonia-lyase, iron-sulfur-dependent, subunit alpha [Deltaproteobacteria bacterium]
MKEDALLKAALMRELIPATGCTEVGTVALAAGWAVRALDVQMDHVESIEIEVDNNTYKNAMGVGIPGTGETGLGFAAAMGALSSMGVCHGLQILENPNPMTVEKARRLLVENRVRIERVSKTPGILIRAKVRSGNEEASAVIQGSHDHLVGVQKNGNPYPGAPISGQDLCKLSDDIKSLRYGDLVKYARTVDLEELPIIRQALQMNVHFCEEAQKGASSQKIGSVVEKYAKQKDFHVDLSAKAQFVTALAVEARMKGLDLPVMTCAGSGNQGLVATIPVVEIAKNIRSSEESLLRALVLSYMTTIYIKTFTGILSPICGCGVAAAVGAGSGIVFLLSGGVSQIEAQVNNMVGAMAGIICDGAKSGCAFKALMAVGLAVDSSYLSMENVRIPSGDGIMGKEVLDTLKNLQKIVEDGMSSMDTAIIEIMDRNV